jgi:hypothetical protein
MPGARTYVEGADLVGLILEIRAEFLARRPCANDDARRPNSLRLVAVDVLEGKSTDEQLAVLRDLLDANGALVVRQEEDDEHDIFEYADTPAAYLTDLVCAICRQILLRDPTLSEEDRRRERLSGAVQHAHD